jgi:type VI secretion system secreted protein VgrG
MNRIITLQGNFSDSDVRFLSLRGRESLSSLYEFDVQVLSTHYGLDSKATLGTPLNLVVALAEGGSRRLAGQVTRMEMVGRESNTSRDYIYRLTVRPWVWFLTCTSDCKIFQKKSVVEIIEEVLRDYDYPVENQLRSAYRQWEYCVQYQETDFNFISRLMEQEGIYYYFRHGETGETLVLADDIGAHADLPELAVLDYQSPDQVLGDSQPGVSNWQSGEEVRPGSYMVGDYDFAKPRADMRQLRTFPQRHANDQFEMYDWMGGFIDQAHAENYSRIRLEEAQALRERTQAQSRLPNILPGYAFTLSGHPRSSENRRYLVVSADYDLREAGYASGSDAARYDTCLTVQPADLPYRAPRVTPFPFTHGPQTAVVVGPEGEEIWTDEFGRVKVQFHWDRYGQNNEDSSCWVRVSSSWAGSNFGGLQIPRIGQEVVVDFINGMPDRPLITGRVYNADQMPPFSFPESRTQSGIVTRSFEQGSIHNANMLRFDDKRGAEQVMLHAERNLDVSVENNENRIVQGSINTVALESINKETPSYSETITQSTSTIGSSTSFHDFSNNIYGAYISTTGTYTSTNGSYMSTNGSYIATNNSYINTNGSYINTNGSYIATNGSYINTSGSYISITGLYVSYVGYKLTH